MPVKPGPATNVRVTRTTPTEIDLAWTPPTTVVIPARYRVRYRPGSSGPWIMNSEIAVFPRMTISGLTPATKYQFEVLVNNGN